MKSINIKSTIGLAPVIAARDTVEVLFELTGDGVHPGGDFRHALEREAELRR